MGRIGLGTKGRRVGLIPDSPNMAAIEAIVLQRVATALSAPWIPMELEQGYGAQHPEWFKPSYRRVGDRVELQGNMTIRTTPSPPQSGVFTVLPEGFRPATNLTIMIGDETQGNMTGFDVTVSGHCRIVRQGFWDPNHGGPLQEFGLLTLCLAGLSFSVLPQPE